MRPRLVKMAEAKRESGLGEKTLRKLADRGHVRCGYTEGGHRLFDLESLQNYLFRYEADRVAIRRTLGL